MNTTLKMTSKRQVTFPVKVCEELGLEPGETILLEKRSVDGKPTWTLQAQAVHEKPSWFGKLKTHAVGKSHDLDSIRESVAQARSKKSK